MRSILLLLLLFINLVGFAQNPTKLKRTEIIVNNQDSTVKAIILLKKVNVKPKNDYVYYWYNSDKIEKNVGGYYGKLLDGKYFVFDRDKNLITQGTFKKGLKKGEWKKWNKKGGLKQIEHMKNGIRNGKVITIDETGKLIATTNYRNGLKNGKYIFISPDSTITKTYKKDKEVIKEPKTKSPNAVDEKSPNQKKEKAKKEKAVKEEIIKSDKPVKKPFWKKKEKADNNTSPNFDH